MKVRVTNSQGGIQEIPEHWLEHEVLGKGFKKVTTKAEPKQPAKKEVGK